MVTAGIKLITLTLTLLIFRIYMQSTVLHVATLKNKLRGFYNLIETVMDIVYIRLINLI